MKAKPPQEICWVIVEKDVVDDEEEEVEFLIN